MIETLAVDGLNVRVSRIGEGPTIVYLHSGNGEIGDFAFARELAERGFSVVGPEFAGFGESEIDPAIESIEDAVYRTRRVLQAVGVEHAAAICGSSFGGWLAVEMLTWWGDLADSLVLIDAAGLHMPERPVLDIFFHTPDVVNEAANPHGVNYMDAFAPAIGSIADEAAVMTHFIKAQAAVARIGWNPYLHDPKLPARLQHVLAPTLILWGADDGLVPPEYGRLYETLLPDATYAEIALAGHLPALEMPGEAAERVDKFVRTGHRVAV